jgi:hypothetical protein
MDVDVEPRTPAVVLSQASLTVCIRVFRTHPYPAIDALEPVPSWRLARNADVEPRFPAVVLSQAGITVCIRVFRTHPYPAISAWSRRTATPAARLFRSSASPCRSRGIAAMQSINRVCRQIARSRVRLVRDSVRLLLR